MFFNPMSDLMEQIYDQNDYSRDLPVFSFLDAVSLELLFTMHLSLFIRDLREIWLLILAG